MSTQALLSPIERHSASQPFPTASDLSVLDVAARPTGDRSKSKDALVFCRGVEIGRLRTFHPPARTDRPAPAIKSTLRTLPGGSPGSAIPGHDVEWLLREHIDHDLGGRRARLAMIRAGVTFIAKEPFALNPREIVKSTNWYVPMMARLEITHVTEDFVSYRWNIPYVPLDVLPRRDFIHGSVDTLPRSTFEYLVDQRLLMPF